MLYSEEGFFSDVYKGDKFYFGSRGNYSYLFSYTLINYISKEFNSKPLGVFPV